MMSRSIWSFSFLMVCLIAGVAGSAAAQLGQDQYAFKIYAVNDAFYPIVQVYMRTFDQHREPLQNVNYMNIGLQVKGRNYDPAKIDPTTRGFQYNIETLQNRQEGFRTVLILDGSLSMRGEPFEDARNALLRFVEAKRANDQVAVISVRNEVEVVSEFERNPTMLYQRIADIQCDGQVTHLYDAIAKAMQMCALASQGGMSNVEGDHAVLNNIVVLSDGMDEGSSLTRADLVARISQLSIPIPINALAFTAARGNRSGFPNLKALSEHTFGRYWEHDATDRLSQTVQQIHRINRSDYVLTFRSYVPVDGDNHMVRVGISWPTNTGRFVYDNVQFQAMDSPALYVQSARQIWEQLNAAYPRLSDDCPYMDCPPPASPVGMALPSGPEASDAMMATTQEQPVTQGSADTGLTESAGPSGAKESPAQDEGNSDNLAAMLSAYGPVVSVGVIFVLLIIIILLWVKRGGAGGGQNRSSGLGTTYPRARAGTTDATNGQRSTGADTQTQFTDSTNRR